MQPSVRKQHNAGFKHKANVRAYFLQFEQQETEDMLERKMADNMARLRQPSFGGPGGPSLPIAGLFRPGGPGPPMAGPPMGMPPGGLPRPPMQAPPGMGLMPPPGTRPSGPPGMGPPPGHYDMPMGGPPSASMPAPPGGSHGKNGSSPEFTAPSCVMEKNCL
jgi:U1 small nuclear ribonucleoprotein C